MVTAFFKEYKIPLIALLSFSVFYFIMRLYHLTSLPIFTDEAIYLRWAQIAKNDANWRFISLTDGKQPLLIWFTLIAMRFFQDPLFSGRIVSVFAGFFTMIGLFVLGKLVFKNTWIGILSAFLYLFFPFGLVYDRMALYDSLVGTFAVWGLIFAVLLVRALRLDVALIFGLVSGMGVLTKTSGFFTLYLLPLSLLLFDFKKKDRNTRLIRWAALAILVTALTYLYYSILRLSPYFYLIDEKNTIFVYPFKEWIHHPFTYFFGNLFIGQWNWYISYVTYPVTVLIIGSFFISKKNFWEKIVLLLWFIIPFLSLALFGKTLYPRFIFFMTLSLLPLAAYSLYHLFYLVKNKPLYGLLLFLSLIFFLYADYYILFDFKSAPIPSSDVNQYNNDWPSGTGVKESVAFFNNEAQNGPIYIATQGTFGLMPYSYELYLFGNKNIIIKGYWPINSILPKEVVQMSKKEKTFFVFYQPCDVCPQKGLAPTSWNVKPVLSIQKAALDARLTVYQVQ